MKNMSFGKMMAVFGGFVLLLIVCAVVIIKMSAKAPDAPEITTKKYTAPPRAARDEPRDARQTGSANGPIANASGTTTTPALPANQMLGMPTAMPAGAQPVVLTDVKPHLSSLDASVDQLNVRVSALENRQLAAMAPQPRAAAPRQAVPRSKSVVVQSKPVVVPTTPLPGYKSMAVVGNRAWVSMPNGAEDSVSAGDPVPRARVRALDRETGVVITTADQHIDTH